MTEGRDIQDEKSVRLMLHENAAAKGKMATKASAADLHFDSLLLLAPQFARQPFPPVALAQQQLLLMPHKHSFQNS